MKNQTLIILAVIFILFINLNAIINQDEYLKLKENTFFLDNQNLHSFQAKIHFSILDEYLNNLKINLNQMNDIYQIDDNIEEFSISYDVENGYTFNKPELYIDIINDEIYNKDEIEKAIDEIERNFAVKVLQACYFIEGKLKAISLPDTEKMEIISIDNPKDSTLIKYSTDIGSIIEKIDNKSNKIHIEMSSKDFESYSTESYEIINNLKTLKTIDNFIKMPSQKIHVVTDYQYSVNDTKNIFPKRIVEKTYLEDTEKPLQNVEINFYNIKWKALKN